MRNVKIISFILFAPTFIFSPIVTAMQQDQPGKDQSKAQPVVCRLCTYPNPAGSQKCMICEDPLNAQSNTEELFSNQDGVELDVSPESAEIDSAVERKKETARFQQIATAEDMRYFYKTLLGGKGAINGPKPQYSAPRLGFFRGNEFIGWRPRLIERLYGSGSLLLSTAQKRKIPPLPGSGKTDPFLMLLFFSQDGDFFIKETLEPLFEFDPDLSDFFRIIPALAELQNKREMNLQNALEQFYLESNKEETCLAFVAYRDLSVRRNRNVWGQLYMLTSGTLHANVQQAYLLYEWLLNHYLDLVNEKIPVSKMPGVTKDIVSMEKNISSVALTILEHLYPFAKKAQAMLGRDLPESILDDIADPGNERPRLMTATFKQNMFDTAQVNSSGKKKKKKNKTLVKVADSMPSESLAQLAEDDLSIVDESMSSLKLSEHLFEEDEKEKKVSSPSQATITKTPIAPKALPPKSHSSVKPVVPPESLSPLVRLDELEIFIQRVNNLAIENLNKANKYILGTIFSKSSKDYDHKFTTGNFDNLAGALRDGLKAQNAFWANDFYNHVAGHLHPAHTSDHGDKLDKTSVDILRSMFVQYGMVLKGWSPSRVRDYAAQDTFHHRLSDPRTMIRINKMRSKA